MKLIGELLNLDEAYEFLDEETEKEKREKRNKTNAVTAESAINTAPQTLAERNNGEWIQLENGSWWCRFCGANDTFFNTYNYCPECGAKMRWLKNE